MPSKKEISLTDQTSVFQKAEPIKPSALRTFEDARRANAEAIKNGNMTVHYDFETGRASVIEWVG